jgi:ParB family transcriptional regulator, chromosome partitioning protein
MAARKIKIPDPKPRTALTKSLRPNPHNPRYLFDDEPMEILRESIGRVGILVPITVYKPKNSAGLVILDGQRRWLCAQDLEFPRVPINQVPEPSTAQNIVMMFQIHKLREDWELMPTALKLEVLMTELQERRDKQIAELTGLDVAVVSRCKKLLWYPKKFQNMMLLADPRSRMKADFFIELHPVVTDVSVRNAAWFDRNRFIERFLSKYKNKKSGLKSVTDFRKVKQYLTTARAAGQEKLVLGKLKKLLDDDERDISSLEIDVAIIRKAAKKFARDLIKIQASLSEINADDYLGEENLWNELENLFNLIKKKLAEADRRLK